MIVTIFFSWTEVQSTRNQTDKYFYIHRHWWVTRGDYFIPSSVNNPSDRNYTGRGTIRFRARNPHREVMAKQHYRTHILIAKFQYQLDGMTLKLRLCWKDDIHQLSLSCRQKRLIHDKNALSLDFLVGSICHYGIQQWHFWCGDRQWYMQHS